MITDTVTFTSTTRSRPRCCPHCLHRGSDGVETEMRRRRRSRTTTTTRKLSSMNKLSAKAYDGPELGAGCL
eukprot:2127085-Pyramimonas_sp.AAC.1